MDRSRYPADGDAIALAVKTKAIPCWLSPKNKAIALTLINDAEFVYLGSVEDFLIYAEELGAGYKLGKTHGWQVTSAYGRLALEAICDGAIFGKSLETLPNIDFESELKITRRVISQASQAWSKSQSIGTQLTLF